MQSRSDRFAVVQTQPHRKSNGKLKSIPSRLANGLLVLALALGLIIMAIWLASLWEVAPTANGRGHIAVHEVAEQIAEGILQNWWAVQDSNLRPPACKAGALTKLS